MEIGEKIKENRIRLGLTQEELGLKVGVQKSAVAKWERGATQRMKRSIIQDLALLFEMQPWELMCLSDDSQMETVSANEKLLMRYFRELNLEGQLRLLEQAEFYISKENYQKNNTNKQISQKQA